MKTSNAIKFRRAIYPSQFQDSEISVELIEKILQNANLAPSHRLTQPWFFKVFQNHHKNRLAKAMIEKYESSNPKQNSDFKKNKILQKCIQSNCIIAIFMTRDVTESVPEWEEIAATAMAVQNMWLTCVENNIGCYWSSPKYMSLMNDFFKLKNNQRCLGFFYMGGYIHKNQLPTNRKLLSEKVEWFL